MLQRVHSDRAKQYVPVTADGHFIGDVLLFYLAPENFDLVGRATTLNWVMFHGEGRDDVMLMYDERTAARPDPENRRHFQFQLQAPNAAGGADGCAGVIYA